MANGWDDTYIECIQDKVLMTKRGSASRNGQAYVPTATKRNTTMINYWRHKFAAERREDQEAADSSSPSSSPSQNGKDTASDASDQNDSDSN